MSIRYTREHRGYPGLPDVQSIVTAEALPTTYATDDNGMQNIGAIVTAMVDGLWYTYCGGEVEPIVDTVGHFLAVNTNLVIHGRWAAEQFRAISDDAVGGGVLAVTYLFPKPPTQTVG